jgi:sulfoxide reductase heme-binding subunit YedZ
VTEAAFVGRVLKPAIFLAALVPAGLLVYAAVHDDLGANPIEAITLTTGRWALRFLLLTLAITPFRRLTKWHAVIRIRRMVGLFAFFYASLHVLTYVVLDHFFDWQSMVDDVVKRRFITAGFLAFVLMAPLAVTSTTGWVRRLGGKRWQMLHRLIYVSAACAIVHFLWKVKVITADPLRYVAVLAVLLAFRVWWRYRRQPSTFSPPSRGIPIVPRD